MEKGIFGHPRGLMTLFFTEMWERFSYYGMRALLILFMVAPATNGGLGFDTPKAARIYGWYTALVYMLAIPGGFAADRFLGLKNAVLVGGIIIALGHFSMAIPSITTFFLGLGLIVIGTGLLKPNVSSLVGALYEENDRRRDAGFSIFYMGINLGAFLAPLVTGYLGQKINWHYGFVAAGVGMTFGLIQYVLGRGNLRDPVVSRDSTPARGSNWINPKFLGLAAVYVGSLIAANYVLKPLGALGELLYILWLYMPPVWIIAKSMSEGAKETERKRIWAIVVLFIFSALFWAAFEQAGSSLNLFADRFTRTTLLNWNFPSSWFQSVNSIFIILLAAGFAWFWLKLGTHEPSIPSKFAYGLLFVGLGFLAVAIAAIFSGPDKSKVSPMWLILVYLCHTIGELCLSPVGLSAVTKLAPARHAGLAMGVWFLSLSMGNKIGGWVAGFFESFPLPKLFGTVFLTTACAALLLAFVVKPIKNLMSGVH